MRIENQTEKHLGAAGIRSSFEQEIHLFFSKDGPLSLHKGFAWRLEQQTMACAVAQALVHQESLLIEAGTGVGKSLAYLVPSILFAIQHQRKTLLSTHTIALQEQLIHKDIPFLQKLLPQSFDAVLLKGRYHYCCGTRLNRALRMASFLLSPVQQQELRFLADWSQVTQDGTLGELTHPPDPQVWAMICSEPFSCTPATCQNQPTCFFQRARRRLQSAQVVVLNHSLFLSLLHPHVEANPQNDIPSGSHTHQDANIKAKDSEQEAHDAALKKGFLFPNDFVVFDEAHTLEKIASQHLGSSFSQHQLQSLLQKLYHPESKRGLLPAIKNQKGMTQIGQISKLATCFFEKIQTLAQQQRTFSIKSQALEEVTVLSDALVQLQYTLHQIDTQPSQIHAELKEISNHLTEIQGHISNYFHTPASDQVYWGETSADGSIRLHSTPINIASTLKKQLFVPGRSAILTSATLATGPNHWEYCQQRMGAEGIQAIQIGTPFDYEHQMAVHVVRQIPDPRAATYSLALMNWIQFFTQQSQGRAFVLFTSYKLMKIIANQMDTFFSNQGWPLFVQGSGKSRMRLIEDFQNSCNGVLFGTDSFWTGVDVPGEALSNVIITRLPFASPTHPVTVARCQAIKDAGKEPFLEYALPEAILKFRQGVGRLIRSHTDHGIVVILDSRIVTTRYGKQFLAALPKCPVVMH